VIEIEPTGEVLGATVRGLNLARPLGEREFGAILWALGQHGVLCFPAQSLDAAALKVFSSRFGTLEINVAAGSFCDPTHPEVMILSNIVENGRPIGLADAGQDWHTDMSYSKTIAFANVLHAVKVPRRNGKPLGGTEFANMHAAYTELPDAIKAGVEGLTALHDFAKFWDKMRTAPGSTRAPLTDEQRRAKPPVSQPVALTHPVTGRKVLYANPGYAVRIDGMPVKESKELLALLFAQQLEARFRYVHHWSEGEVLMWDDIGTLHYARPDYGPEEHRLMRRCQVMADRVFDPAFAMRATPA
jgi:taurine dioxygenase